MFQSDSMMAKATETRFSKNAMIGVLRARARYTTPLPPDDLIYMFGAESGKDLEHTAV